MPVNTCVPLFTGGDPDLTVRASAAVVGKTFGMCSATIESGPVITTVALPATFDGGNLKAATCTAALKADGVFAYDAAITTLVPLLRSGSIVPVTSGAAITAGVQVEVGTAGKAITLASGIAVGKAWSTVAGADLDCYIEIY